MTTSYHVYGFRRDDYSVRISVIVDSDGGEAFKIAGAIAGPEYCLHASSNILHSVPDAAKNRLFMSDEELFATVPEMNPKQRRVRRQKGERR